MFVSLGIQHAMRVCYIGICGLPAVWYFSTLSCSRHHFRKKKIEHKMCILVLSTIFL